MSTVALTDVAAKRRRRRGLTLIEAAMVLTILALVVGAVMLYYQSAATNNRTTEAAGQLAAIQQAVRSMYAGQPTFAGLNNDQVRQNLPVRMSGGTAGVLRHAFNGTVTIAPTDVGGGPDSGFTVQFAGVPAEACQRLATVDLGRAVTNLEINGTAGAVPRTPNLAQTQCGGGGSSTLRWTFF